MRNKPAVILWLYHTDLSEEFTKVLFTHRTWQDYIKNPTDIIDKDNFDFTVKKLERKDIGLVGSHSFIMRDNEYTNHNKILELCSLFNIDYLKLRLKSFIGGNVFAAKTKNFTPLLYNDKVKELLSQEIGLIKDDDGGTYVHSMERLFGYMAEYHNQTIYGGPHNTQIVLNTKIKKHRLHLVKLYNNNCYMQENPNVYGEIIQEDHNKIVINWLNVVEHPPQTYKKYPKYLLNTNVIT